MLLTKQINGVEICYDESGYAGEVPIVLISGWAHDLRLYDQMLPLLVDKHWVIRVCWRGHGPSRDDIPDFGVEEQVDDTLKLLDSLNVDRFYLVSHSHGGWPAIEMANRSGPARNRVISLLMIDQIMTAPPEEFVEGLKAMQSEDTWREARRNLFADWLADSTNKAVDDHFKYCMSSYGFRMWSLSCRVIANAYKSHGSPLGLMEKIQEAPPIRHIFSHPLNRSEYRELHASFAKKHPWFSYRDLKGQTHFPDIEIPEDVVAEIEDLIARGDSS